MFALLNDILAARSTSLARCDARVVVSAGLALVAACLASSWWLLPAVVAAAVLTAGWSLGLPVRLIAEGVAALRPGMDLAARVVGASAVLVLLGSTVPVHRLAVAARWLRAPLLLVELLLLMYRFVFVLLDRAEAGLDAQRLRLGWRDRRRALASAGQLSGLMLVRALDQAGRTAEAMRLRGGAGRLPLPPVTPLPTSDGLSIIACVALVVACWALCERLP
jgi:energy-coupling factor transporter transmembrane protein EcfT